MSLFALIQASNLSAKPSKPFICVFCFIDAKNSSLNKMNLSNFSRSLSSNSSHSVPRIQARYFVESPSISLESLGAFSNLYDNSSDNKSFLSSVKSANTSFQKSTHLNNDSFRNSPPSIAVASIFHGKEYENKVRTSATLRSFNHFSFNSAENSSQNL
jgi:hypothetical protein